VARQVIIHMPDIEVDAVRWVTADDNGRIVDAVASGSFADVAEKVEGKRSVLVLPGDDVTLTEAKVPGGSVARASQAVRYELEEQLADDVETLHFALGAKSADDVFPVAVIGNQTMDSVLSLCADVGLRPTQIVPETLAIPSFDKSESGTEIWTALVDGEKTLVRSSPYQGFSINTDLADMALHGAQQNLADDATAAMVLYKTNAMTQAFDVPPGIEVETRDCDDSLALFAAGLASAPTINLLQGGYSPKTQLDKAWKPWRWTAALAAVLALILFGGKWFDYQSLKEKENALDAGIAAAFKEALPGKRMVRPRSQIKTALNALGGGNSAGFTITMHAIAESFATQPDTTIRAIAVRNGRFDLDVTTDALPTLDALKTELENRGGLTLTVQSNTREKDGIRSRLRIE